MDVGMLCEQRPVKPVRFVILAIGIVVPALCSPPFITHEKHGHTNRKHRYSQKILHLPVSKLLYGGIIGEALDSPVSASVFVGAITVFRLHFFCVLGII